MKKLSTLGFIVLSLVLVLALAYKISSGKFSIDTNLLSLLPKSQQNKIHQLAEKQLLKMAGNNIIIAIATDDADLLDKIALTAYPLFCSQTDIAKCHDLNNHSLKAFTQAIYQQRFYLLDANQIQAIDQQPENIINNAIKSLYGFNAKANFYAFADDPLGLVNERVQKTLTKLSPLAQRHGLLQTQEGETFYLLLPMQLTANSFNLQYQEQFMQWYSTKNKELVNTFKNIDIINSGAIFHASDAAIKAQQEIIWISVLSIFGIFMIFFISRFSAIAFLLSLSSIAYGCFAAFTISIWIFDSIHLITLVFGASLLGVSIDYSLHYFCDHQRKLSKLLPPLALGLLSSCIGYGILFLSQLPALRQIAIFCVCGLLFAWLFVVIVHPHFAKLTQANIRSLLAPQWINKFWLNLNKKAVLAIWLMAMSISSWILYHHANFSTDIRTLYAANQKLINNELTVQKLMQTATANQFFLISAATLDELIEQEKKLTEQLLSTNTVDEVLSLASFIPNKNQQQQSYNRYQQKILANNGMLENMLNQLGADKQILHSQKSALSNAKAKFDSVSFVKSLPEQIQFLYLGKYQQQQHSIMLLKAINNHQALASFSNHHVQFYDKVTLLSQSLNQQLKQTLTTLLIAYLLIAVCLFTYFKKLSSLFLLAIPLSSSIISLAIIASLGMPISLFHSFGLFLILGLGMDYVIFLYAKRTELSSTQTAISLSALTSCLAFGLLAFSSTPMIASFGLCVLLGSLLNLVLSPSVLTIKANPHA